MSHLPIDGGPWDGSLGSCRGGFIRYLDSQGRAHSHPAPDRAPYRRLSTKWVHAPFYRTCQNCGAILECVESVVKCMCGEPVERTRTKA